MPTRPLVTLAVVVAVVLAGCRIDVATQVDVAADGSGTLTTTVQVDRETADTLSSLGVSLRPAAVAGWESSESSTDDHHEVVVATDFASATELTDRVDELGSGLDGEDPAILEDLVLEVTADGAATLAGRAGLRLPSSAGADAPGWPTAEELRDMADDIVVTLAVTFPGSVEESNATTVDGRTATWDLPVGSLQPVTAASAAPSPWQQGWVRWAVVTLGIVVLLAVLAALRRGRRQRVEAPLGRIDRMRRSL